MQVNLSVIADSNIIIEINIVMSGKVVKFSVLEKMLSVVLFSYCSPFFFILIILFDLF